LSGAKRPNLAHAGGGTSFYENRSTDILDETGSGEQQKKLFLECGAFAPLSFFLQPKAPDIKKAIERRPPSLHRRNGFR
jgi:hypothetical protein